jgi:hypothetical protein
MARKLNITWKEGPMISSPCKTCEMRNEPKENCYKNCKFLQSLQYAEISYTRASNTLGIDFSDEGRYSVRLSTANGLAQEGLYSY